LDETPRGRRERRGRFQGRRKKLKRRRSGGGGGGGGGVGAM